ncbi:hypothetical protein QZH41_017283 [Actinostola sp. cb2023]|nr:hypothetical protein QZH41_017283 [Actinostola sp. cb2023]
MLTSGLAMSMFEVGGLIGCTTSGYISDGLVNKSDTKSSSSPRMPLVLIYLLGLTVSLYAFHSTVTMTTPKIGSERKPFVAKISPCYGSEVKPFLSVFQVIIYMFMLAIGCTALGPINIFGVLAVENSPPGLTSTTHGFVALAASVGATMAGYPLSILTKYYDWNGMMVSLQVVSLLALIIVFCTRNISSAMDVCIRDKTK